MIDFSQYQLGVTPGRLTLETSGDSRAAAIALVGQARRNLEIYTRDLDKPIYDDPNFIDAVRGLAIRAKQAAAIRILVKDSSRAVKYGHRLIPLCQRLTSFIEVRKPPEQYREYNEALLVVDGVGHIHRTLADRPEGTVYFHAPIETRRLLVFFNEVWQSGEADPELRRLYL